MFTIGGHHETENIVELFLGFSNRTMHVFRVLSGLSKAVVKIGDEVGKPGVELLDGVDAL